MNTKLFFLCVAAMSVCLLFVSFQPMRTPEPHIRDSRVSNSRRPHRRDGILCQNDDFLPQYHKSVWTMLTHDPNYILSTLKLGHSLRLHTTTEQFDMVVMELASKPLSSTAWRCLSEIGWKRCVVDRIAPLQEGVSRAYRYVDQFTKLRLWGMTMYHTVVYLDADTMVLRSISHLLNCNLGNHTIGVAAQNWYDKVDVFSQFNMGVVVIHPAEHEYERLLKLQRDPSVKFDAAWAEQGFLNVVYKDKWYDFGLANNALTWYTWQNHSHWTSQYAHFNVVHFGGFKPWAWACFPDNMSPMEYLTIPSAYYTSICKTWSDLPPQTCENLI